MATPENPNTQLPMAKRTDDQLKLTVVYKLWQAANVEGPMASMTRKDSLGAAIKARDTLVSRGMEIDDINTLWVEWRDESGFVAPTPEGDSAIATFLGA